MASDAPWWSVDAPWWSALVPLLAAIFSATASLVLLLWLRRLSSSMSSKLMARQLWHLALADLLNCLVIFPWFLLGILYSGGNNPHFQNKTLNELCKYVYGNNIPFITSVLTEVHIALATTATIFRHPRSLHVLDRALPLVWPLGLAVGGFMFWEGKPHWDAGVGLCDAKRRGELVKAGILAVALVICIATYVAGLATVSLSHGGSVERRTWRRASMFLIAAVLTWLPFVVYTLWPRSEPDIIEQSTEVWFYLAQAANESNGLLNTSVYLWQSSFLRRVQQQAGAPERIEDGDRLTDISLGVAFRSFDEVVIFSGNTAIANVTAEAEVAASHESPARGENCIFPDMIESPARGIEAPTVDGIRQSESIPTDDFLASFSLASEDGDDIHSTWGSFT